MYHRRLAVYHVLNVALVAFNILLWTYQPENRAKLGDWMGHFV